ncbi:NUDIX hydrolase [Gammaproteobacteria bacterium 45_16_T64]|nr:NUDIX hydrolase [Gammaproteobacteria bacterium 45_16_T64]
MTWTPHATVATILEKNGKFLFVEEYSNNKAVINQPAGHVEPNETIIDASIRETLEESGWLVDPQYLVGIYTYTSPINEITYYRFCFASSAVRFIKDHPIDSDIHGQCWLTPEELHARQETHRGPLVAQCMKDYLAGKRYPLSLIYEHPKGS